MWNRDLLRELIQPTDTVLDLGSGDGQVMRSVPCALCVGVDIWPGATCQVRHDLRVVPYPFEDRSFDVAVSIGSIEHLTRQHGQAMLSEMERIARRRLIVFTPCEFRDNRHNVDAPGLWSTGNQHNLHISLWTPEDFAGWLLRDYIDPGYIFAVKDLVA